jgi:hypothetical protein
MPVKRAASNSTAKDDRTTGVIKDNSTLAYQPLPRITSKKQQGFPHQQVKEAQQ